MGLIFILAACGVFVGFVESGSAGAGRALMLLFAYGIFFGGGILMSEMADRARADERRKHKKQVDSHNYLD